MDAIVLGCTHYVFLKEAVRRFFPAVPVLDGNEGTVLQLRRVLAARGLLCPETQSGTVRILSSDSEEHLAVLRQLYESPFPGQDA